MWLDQTKIDALEQALKSGQKGGVSSILAGLNPAGKNPAELTFCPKCGKPFVRKVLSFLRMVVPACPEKHGVWLSEANAIKIKRFFESDHANRPHGLDQRVTGILLGMLIMTSFAVLRFLDGSSNRPVYHNYKTTYSMEHLQPVNPEYWPNRDFSQWNAFPQEQHVITDAGELAYFKEWMIILNEGIVNRLNMNDALLAKRTAQEYAEVFNFFAQKQNNIVERLRELYPPGNLQVFHNLVIEAGVNQIDFYDDFVRQKASNPSIKFTELLNHPKLKLCDQKLWAAYYEFQRIYPNRDPGTNNAIEQRLCWMDLI